MNQAPLPFDERTIQSLIHCVRGQKVMLVFDLAEIYGYETRYLNLQVRRNAEEFPEDFMFQLRKDEMDRILMLQNVTSSWGGDKENVSGGGGHPFLNSQNPPFLSYK